MMTFLYCTVSLIVLLIAPCTATRRDVDWLEVVPHFEELENFYQQTRRQNAKSYNGKERTTHSYAKNRVCWNMLASGYFDMEEVGLEPVDMDLVRVYYELTLMYPDLVKKVYEKLMIPEFSTELEQPYQYTNPTNVIKVHFKDETAPEYAFICLGRSRSTNKIVEFYVSEEYNISRGLLAQTIGRFMFTSNGDDRAKLSYFAEEPARVLTKSNFNIEHLYRQARENRKLIPTPSVDPLCKLNVHKRLQICTSVLSSPIFDDDIDYVPHIDSVSAECGKWTVAFEDVSDKHEKDESAKQEENELAKQGKDESAKQGKDESAKQEEDESAKQEKDESAKPEKNELAEQEEDKSVEHEEWMIECRAISSVTDTPVSYYLSQAYGPNKVFVHRPKDNAPARTVYPENLCVNVRNV